MLSALKFIYSLTGGLFICMGTLRGQVKDSLVSQELVDLFLKQLDSLPSLIADGKMQRIHSGCLLPGHIEYHRVVNGIHYYFPDDALRLDKRKRPGYARMHAIKNQTLYYYEKKEYTKAIRLFEAALQIAKENKFYFEELHNLRPGLNNNCFLSGDFETAMRVSTEGLATAEMIGDKKQAAHFNNAIGCIHLKLGNHPDARRYFTNELKGAKELRDTSTTGHALLNLADLAVAEKDYDKAIAYLDEALMTYRSKKSSGTFTPVEREGYIANKKASVFKLKGDHKKAMPLVLTALAILRENEAAFNAYDKAEIYINTADIYNHVLLPDSAILFSQKGMEIARSIIHREFMRDAYEQLAIAYSQKHDFPKAFTYQKLFTKLKDSIAEETNQREIYQREAALQLELQRQMQQSTLQRQRTWRNIIIGIAVLSIVMVIFLYNRYRLKQKNRYQKELNRQQIELFNAIAATQEQERKRIAQDIHDSLGSILSAAKLKMAEVKDNKPELSGDEKFISGINLLDEASSELRNISHNIMPATLSKLGLVPALKNLAEKISTHKGLQVHFIAHELDSRLEEQTEISVYRIVLELINNVVKHAAATKATVQLIKYPDHINITVEDNGKGFDAVKMNEEKTGIGLGNVMARVEYLKGKLDIDTMPGKGTTVVVDIPFA
ncbi:MAG: tetratricopeptide repeat protein [Chitinophagaceae bacterium]|nr:tetratricopeptide repeat protein [Chitinophagaceae bacterium]